MALKAKVKSKTKVNKERISIVDVTLDLPEEVTDQLTLRVVLDSRAIETTRKATDALIISRRLPLKGQDIQVVDPLALLILAQDKTLDGAQAAYKAERIYEGWRQDAEREALVIGMTMMTEISREPRPYDDEVAEDDDTPAWLADDLDLPEPERDLTNRYEYRLKQIYDILEDAGPLFAAKFDDILNNDIAKRLREMGVGGDTDEAGFPTGRTGKEVPGSPVSSS